jgi:Putative O-antigen polymerase
MTLRRIVAPIAIFSAAALSLVLAFVIVAGNLGARWSRPGTAAQLVLLAVGCAAVVSLRRRYAGGDRVGAGVYLAALALSGALLLGLWAGGDRIAAHRTEITVLFALAVISLVVGATVCAIAVPERSRPEQLGPPIDVLRLPLVFVLAAGLLALAALNLATGSIPLLAANIDAVRISGSGGILARLWIWLIGGVEWVLVVVGTRCIVRGRFGLRGAALGISGLGILTLLASRSFFVIVAIALLVAYGTVRRLSLAKLAALTGVGIVALGAFGALRVNHSDPTGVRRQYLQSQQIDTAFGLISQSAAAGPAVLAAVLDDVPALIPYQHGRFALRDFRATVPLHPFGHPLPADVWVTETIVGRDPAEIGGSPPTLVGGLYIDFGPLGIVIGSFLIGFLLVLLYRWARAARTLGSLVAYSYASAYIALSAYSYVSVKPTVIVVLVLSYLVHRVELGRTGSDATRVLATPLRSREI